MNPLIQLESRTKTRAKTRRWYRSPKLIRHAVMAFFFAFLIHVVLEHQAKGGGPNGAPSVEAYCPFGGIENLYQFLTTGGFVRHIEPSAMVILGAVLLLTLLASRGFCGWICPFGSVQEWLGILGRKLFRKRYNPAGAWDRRLRYLKYVILAAIVVLTWHTGALVFRDYDPFLAFFHLGFGLRELPWAYATLALVGLGSLWIERFFCKYACPLGAVLGIIGKAGLTRVQRDPEDCKGCNLCRKTCFAHIDFLSVTTIRDAECNHCLDCVVDCPKPNVLGLRGPRWRFSHPAYAALLLGGLFTFVGVSMAYGKWQTGPAAVSFVDNSGQLDAGNIRGWMTLGDISQGYAIPLTELYRRGGLPAAVAPDTRLNQIAGRYGLAFEPESLRDAVGAFLAGKQPAAKNHAGPPQPAQYPGGGEQDVKGFMTLNEISMKTHVPVAFLLKRLGADPGINPRVPVREWMHGKGKSIQDVRDAVKSYQP